MGETHVIFWLSVDSEDSSSHHSNQAIKSLSCVQTKQSVVYKEFWLPYLKSFPSNSNPPYILLWQTSVTPCLGSVPNKTLRNAYNLVINTLLSSFYSYSDLSPDLSLCLSLVLWNLLLLWQLLFPLLPIPVPKTM